MLNIEVVLFMNALGMTSFRNDRRVYLMIIKYLFQSLDVPPNPFRNLKVFMIEGWLENN